jgi:hypothetical protein
MTDATQEFLGILRGYPRPKWFLADRQYGNTELGKLYHQGALLGRYSYMVPIARVNQAFTEDPFEGPPQQIGRTFAP